MHVERVRPRSSRFDRHLGTIAALVGVALVVAIVKPWGPGSAPASLPIASPSPGPSVTPAPAFEVGYETRVYDPSIFGTHEPEPGWAIWPAGFLVTLGFVIQVPGLSEPIAGPSPGASDSLASGPPGASPSSSPSRGPVGSAGDPVWPTRFEVPNGNHLLLIGINMPKGHSVRAVGLTRIQGTNAPEVIAASQFRSPWPAHFAVIGVPVSPGDTRLTVWPPGVYRLDLTFDPGGVERSIEISIVGSVP